MLLDPWYFAVIPDA